jgi:hypothetical protein
MEIKDRVEGHGRNDQANHHVRFPFASAFICRWLTPFSFSCEAQLMPTVMALGMLIQYATSYNSFINFFFMYVTILNPEEHD